MGKYVIGLDNGGTSTKAAIFDLAGREIATAGKQTKVITPKSGYTERDMEELWLFLNKTKNVDEVRNVALF